MTIQIKDLLQAYDRGEFSLGQIAIILNSSKEETIELLKKHDIPFVRVDSEYLEQEFEAFEINKSLYQVKLGQTNDIKKLFEEL